MKLPHSFKPRHKIKLIRIGKNNDGGYLVGNKSLITSKYLISLGISDDWTFEIESLKINSNLKIHSYDDQLGYKFLTKAFFFSFFRIFYFKSSIKNFINKKKNLINFVFIKKKINLKKQLVTYRNIKSIVKLKKNIFFKIDIEGYEYRILEDLLKIKNKINAIVIEFHDVDLHRDKIIHFIQHINLKLTHIHPNNYSIPDKYGNPTSLEMSFEKSPSRLNGNVILPNKLDMKCDPLSKDYNLKFNNIK